MNDFYVYLHRRRDTNEVFYVGKGRGRRAYVASGRSAWWTAVNLKHGRDVEFVEKNLSEHDAFLLEIETIKFYRENNHELCNLQEGGEGPGMARLTDGDVIDLDILVCKTIEKETSTWSFKNRLALNVVIMNLLIHGVCYYYTSCSTTENSRDMSWYRVGEAVKCLEKLGYITVDKCTPESKVKRPGRLEATPLLYKKFNTELWG